MATNETPTVLVKRAPFMERVIYYILSGVMIVAIAMGIYTVWPTFMEVVNARWTGQSTVPVVPTARPVQTAGVSQPSFSSQPVQAVPTASLAQVEATSLAVYHATVEAVEARPNINNTGDSAPLVRETKPVDRLPAQGVVPTAEPVIQAETGGIFGSKPVIVNPQQDHSCKHGQVWVDDKGCKNPTPTR